MSSEEDSIIEKESSSGGGFEYIKRAFGIILGNIVGVGIPTIFVIIFGILKYVFIFIFFIIFTVVPFLVKYIGIPLFIVGAIMALLFFGGHLFFTITLVVGVFLYIKGIYKLTINLPKQAKDMDNNSGPTNSGYKIKN